MKHTVRYDDRQSTVMHVDMDAFFVSVEEILNPTLRGKPVIVGGDPNRRGVVSAASYRAREYGVKSGMSAAEARRLCPKAIFLRGSHHIYAEYSGRVMDILGRYTPVVEQVSVDEAYLDLTGCQRMHKADPMTIAQRIHGAIRNDVGLPASIGIGSSRLIAKIATNTAKPSGIMLVRPGYEASFLAPLPIAEIPGIGPATEKIYRKMGIRFIGDLLRFEPRLLKQAFGKRGGVMAVRARGVDTRSVGGYGAHGGKTTPYSHKSPKGLMGTMQGGEVAQGTGRQGRSVSREITYATDTEDPNRLRATLSYLAESVGRRVRKSGLVFKTVSVKLRHSDFKTFTCSRALARPCDDTSVIFKTADELLERLLTKGARIRLVGVAVSTTDQMTQLDLFDSQAKSASALLHRNMDIVRDRFGFESVLMARSCLHSFSSRAR